MKGPLRLANGGIVAPQDVRVGGGLAEELGRLEDLALGLYPLVIVLNLLVEPVRLQRSVSGGISR